ncbi:MAG: type II toxin-antitoxin system RelE/ParE family toxin [Noviherbaspirillum sp.]
MDHYSRISPNLANRFLDDFYALLLRLELHPGIGACRYAHLLPDHSLRFGQLAHFPFLVFYRWNEVLVDILRILHERRDLPAELTFQ